MMPPSIMKKGLISDYRSIRLTPYDPQVWIGRAGTLLGLGYGELAVADAYRARLLVDAFLHPQLIPVYPNYLASLIMKTVMNEFPPVQGQSAADYWLCLQERFRKLDQSAILMMSQGLICIRAQYDATQVLKEGPRRYPNHVIFTALLQTAKHGVQTLMTSLKMQGQEDTRIEWTKKRGRLNKQAYPWIVPAEVDRGTKAIKKLKVKLEAASSKSCIGSSSHGSDLDDSFGVFAKQDIRKGDKILHDKSIFGVYNIPGGDFCWGCSTSIASSGIVLECCKAKFCSESYKAEVMCNYHKALCKKDFQWLYDECRDVDPVRNEMIPLLMMKILATAVQQGASAKVLKVGCVNTLKPNYESQVPAYFKLFDNIIAPLKVLQTLGVDVFAESRFDSWVLQTLFWRIENNKQGTGLGKRALININPMFTMINHDCSPNAIYGSSNGYIGGGIDVIATHNIKEGEEICISYVERGLPETERRSRVMVSIGKACECKRCVGKLPINTTGEKTDSFDFRVLAQNLQGRR